MTTITIDALITSLSENLNRYENDIEMTFGDLIDKVSGRAEESRNPDLISCVRDYRTEEHKNFTT